jgi:hypothetical protein
VVPADIPVNVPALLMVATETSPLIHEPPGTPSASIAVLAWHTCIVPVMAAGNELTVTGRTLRQPVPSVYVISVVPEARPFARPVVLSIVATTPVLLAQVPPAEPLPNNAVPDSQNWEGPVIGAGNGFTVIPAVILQLVGKV